MPLVTTAVLVADAQTRGRGLGSFNVICIEHAEAIAAASEQSGWPALHLDHVTDDTLLRQAADTGFSSVMYDASTLEHAANVEATYLAGARSAMAQTVAHLLEVLALPDTDL